MNERVGSRRVGAGLVLLGLGMLAIGLVVLVATPAERHGSDGRTHRTMLLTGGGVGPAAGLLAWRGSHGGRWAGIVDGGLLAT